MKRYSIARIATPALALGLALGISAGARGASFTALERTIEFTPPARFCVLGDSPRERTLFDQSESDISRHGALMQMDVPCDELPLFKAGKVFGFTRWIEVAVISQGGEFHLVSVPRDDFVRTAAGTLEGQVVDYDEINRRLKALQADGEISLPASLQGMHSLGVANHALFIQSRTKVGRGKHAVALRGIGAVTTANDVPLIVQVYALSTAGRDDTLETAYACVQALLDAN